MKIGILTWFYGANYGAKAQAFALQETIKALGHEPCMINYKNPNYVMVNMKMNLFNREKILNSVWNSIIRCHRFEKSNSIYYISPKVHDAIEIDKLDLDCVVLGSDAIFNQNHPLFSEIYYGVDLHTSKIVFSPSCESLSPNTVLSDDIIASLKEMKAISVRDIYTQKLIINNIGIKPIITLDPTMLYDFQDIKANFFYEGYVLIYTFSEWNEYGTLFRDFANKRGLKIVAVGRVCSWADYSMPNASFSEWVESFRNAEIVITDSFHGTVFSIKNKKEFILLSRVNKTEKISSLMKEINIDKSFYNGKGSIDEYLENNSIDYLEAKDVCDREITKSIHFLKEAIAKC